MTKTNSIAAPVTRRLIRSGLKTFLWLFLLACVCFIVLIASGYIGASKSISYLPEINLSDLKLNNDTNVKAEIRNPGYIVSAKTNGDVCVKTTNGGMIMSGLKWYSSYEGYAEKWGLDGGSINASSDSTISITGYGPAGTLVNLLITLPHDKQKIDMNISTWYSAGTIVRREGLLAEFQVPVSEIYRKNREADTASFDSEYWLQREGVRFGKGERSALIYHTSDVSSLQVDTKRRLLLINLEYYLDHPFFNIPYQNDGGGRWNDLSEASYKKGDTRRNSFSINFGDFPRTIPRIMLVPGGYLAGYVFTEHADGGNIKTHRAAYFGSEDIENIADAEGGFSGYKIPVTKSIFFPDIDVQSSSSGMKDTVRTKVLDFMDQLNLTGNYDICLHGANSNRKRVEEWIKFMKDRFDATTWIDHGMFAGTGNRQSFVCDGLNPSSEYYSGDLWDKYQTKYFWNASVEELRKLPVKENIFKLRFYEASLNFWRRYFSAMELRQMRFPLALKELIRRVKRKGELNSLVPSRGNAFPTPLFWKHPTRTQNFYSWTTDYVRTFSHSDLGVKKEEVCLRKLISERGIFINHGYFVRNLYEDGVLINSDGKIKTNPYFDKTLGIMAGLREKGDLYISTIRDLLEYWKLIENISFDYMPDGTIYINNLNTKAISAFSMAIKADALRIDGEIPKCRRSGDDTVFWFDFPAGKRILLQAE